MAEGRLKHFGWGREGEGLTAAEEKAALDRYRRLFGVDRFEEATPPPLTEIRLRAPRLTPPAARMPICSTEAYDRVAIQPPNVEYSKLCGKCRRVRA